MNLEILEELIDVLMKTWTVFTKLCENKRHQCEKIWGITRIGFNSQGRSDIHKLFLEENLKSPNPLLSRDYILLVILLNENKKKALRGLHLTEEISMKRVKRFLERGGLITP